jgi:hypothetical protein
MALLAFLVFYVVTLAVSSGAIRAPGLLVAVGCSLGCPLREGLPNSSSCQVLVYILPFLN